MKRQILLGLSGLLMLLGVSTRGYATIYEVKTAEEFITHWTANDSIHLAADIDLSSFTEDNTVNNYTAELSGVKPDDPKSMYIIKNAPEMLAEEMHGAYIHDVMLMDCKPDWDDGVYDTHQGTAVLARYTYNCRFYNINLYRNVVDGTSFTNMSSDASCFVCQDNGSEFIAVHANACKAYCMHSYAGILVAEAKNSQFLDCSADYGCAVYADGTTDNCYTGGLVGEATNSKFYYCDNRGYVAGGKDCVGGISGKSTNTNYENCNNYGSVANTKYESFNSFSALSDAMYGSLPSQVTCDEIERDRDLAAFQVYADRMSPVVISALSAGTLKAMDLVALSNNDALNTATASKYQMLVNQGIENEIDMENLRSLIKGDVKTANTYSVQSYVGMAFSVLMAAYQIGTFVYQSQDDDNVGGITGLMDGGSVKYCANFGSVYTADAYAGGIVGQARNANPVIESCQNSGLVKGYEQTGGIVGSIESGTVKACLNTGNISNGNSSKTTFGKIYGEKDDDVTSVGNLFASNKLDDETADCRGVTMKMLASGEAALLLNAAADSAAWRQTIKRDYYPNLIASCDTVTESSIQSDKDPTVRTKNANTFVRALVNQYSDIVLTGDVNLNQTLYNLSSQYMPFCGTVDGQDYSLTGIYYIIPYFNKETVFSNDNSTNNAGLLAWANGATFRNLTLDNCKIDYNMGFGNYCGILVGHSDRCTYRNIHLTNGSGLIQPTDNNGTLAHSGGLIGYSNHDIVTDCTTDALCNFTGAADWNSEDTYIGGLIGDAWGTEITRCINQAPVTVNDDYVGGIVAYINEGKIKSCLNTGNITGEEQVGGIVGWARNSDVINCVNTGTVAGNATQYTDGEIGGIAGTYEQEDATGNSITLCCNWGAVNNQSSDYYDQCGAIIGESSPNDDAITQTNNYWCFTKDGVTKTSDNLTADDLASGKFTYNYNINNAYPLYQDIDLFTFATNKPVPMPAAGTVYLNYLCDGSRAYSNTDHHTTGAHTSDPDMFGLCSVCGAVKKAPSSVIIENAEDLQRLAYATDKGQSFDGSSIYLTADCDMQNMKCFPIGTAEHPFSGNFNGYNHRIKNMTIDATSYAGLFGCVEKGLIEGVIMDSTCIIRSTGSGVAGIVGVAASAEGSDNSITIQQCGNEANVSGGCNTAGILGGVYGNTNMSAVVNDCYNTGTIQGTKESAALIGFGGRKLTLSTCFNTGKVTGYDTDYAVARYYTEGDVNISKLYQLDGLPQDKKAETVTAQQCADATLLYNLDSQTTVWGQNLGNDATPTLTPDVYHEREINGHWGAFMLPYSVVSNDSITLYQIKDVSHESNSGKATVTLESMDKVDANTPCIFYYKGKAKTITLASAGNLVAPTETAVTATLTADLSITGTYTEASLGASDYLCNTNALWLASSLSADAVKASPFQAYFTSSSLSDKVNKIKLVSLNFDVNRNGDVEISDVNVLINILLGKATGTHGDGDVNADGKVNITDVTDLVNIIMDM